MTLSDIKAEAARLTRADEAIADFGAQSAKKSEVSQVEDELRILKNKRERGAISSEEYADQKQLLLQHLSE